MNRVSANRPRARRIPNEKKCAASLSFPSVIIMAWGPACGIQLLEIVITVTVI